MRQRKYIADLSLCQSSAVSNDHLSSKVASYFGRKDDGEQLKEAIDIAYSMGIGSLSVGDSSVESYARSGEMRDKLDLGQIDAINSGWGQRVIDAKATLFTEKGVKFSLATDTDTDIQKAKELLQSKRDGGNFMAHCVEADKVSVAVGSCGLLVSYLRGSLRYRRVLPGAVRAYFAETVKDGDIERPSDPMDLDDATVVLVNMGPVDRLNYSYIGIVTSCDAYPYGRYVSFISSGVVTSIPLPGDKNTFDYRINAGVESENGTPVNPLSYMAASGNYPDLPEIPITIFYGGTTDIDCLMPWTDSLHRQALAFDKKSSHILDISETKATGTLAVMQSHEAQGKPLPRVVTGTIALQAGQTVEDVAHDASSCEIAHSIKRSEMIDCAAGYGVPDYMVISEDHTLDASSGVALEIKSRPLAKDREYRVSINRPSVDRLFKIERALIEFKGEADEADRALLMQCRQVWDASVLTLPENKKEKTDRLISLHGAGVIDIITMIREYYQLGSDEDAISVYQSMADRKQKFPALNAEEKAEEKEIGLLRGMNRKAAK